MKITLRSSYQETESLWRYQTPRNGGPKVWAFVAQSFPNTWEGDGDGTVVSEVEDGECYAVVYHSAIGDSFRVFNDEEEVNKDFVAGVLQGTLNCSHH